MASFRNIDPDVHFFQPNDRCDYYSPDSISNYLNDNDNKCIRAIHINIRSCKKNLNEFFINLDAIRSKFSIIISTETWLNCIEDFQDVIGFVSYLSIRQERQGGGVSILVKSNLESKLVPHLTTVNDVFETLSVEFKMKNKVYKIIGT